MLHQVDSTQHTQHTLTIPCKQAQAILLQSSYSMIQYQHFKELLFQQITGLAQYTQIIENGIQLEEIGLAELSQTRTPTIHSTAPKLHI